MSLLSPRLVSLFSSLPPLLRPFLFTLTRCYPSSSTISLHPPYSPLSSSPSIIPHSLSHKTCPQEFNHPPTLHIAPTVPSPLSYVPQSNSLSSTKLPVRVLPCHAPPPMSPVLTSQPLPTIPRPRDPIPLCPQGLTPHYPPYLIVMATLLVPSRWKMAPHM